MAKDTPKCVIDQSEVVRKKMIEVRDGWLACRDIVAGARPFYFKFERVTRALLACLPLALLLQLLLWLLASKKARSSKRAKQDHGNRQGEHTQSSRHGGGRRR